MWNVELYRQLRRVDFDVEEGSMALGTLAAIVACDEQQHGTLPETLVAYLDALGDD